MIEHDDTRAQAILNEISPTPDNKVPGSGFLPPEQALILKRKITVRKSFPDFMDSFREICAVGDVSLIDFSLNCLKENPILHPTSQEDRITFIETQMKGWQNAAEAAKRRFMYFTEQKMHGIALESRDVAVQSWEKAELLKDELQKQLIEDHIDVNKPEWWRKYKNEPSETLGKPVRDTHTMIDMTRVGEMIVRSYPGNKFRQIQVCADKRPDKRPRFHNKVNALITCFDTPDSQYPLLTAHVLADENEFDIIELSLGGIQFIRFDMEDDASIALKPNISQSVRDPLSRRLDGFFSDVPGILENGQKLLELRYRGEPGSIYVTGTQPDSFDLALENNENLASMAADQMMVADKILTVIRNAYNLETGALN